MRPTYFWALLAAVTLVLSSGLTWARSADCPHDCHGGSIEFCSTILTFGADSPCSNSCLCHARPGRLASFHFSSSWQPIKSLTCAEVGADELIPRDFPPLSPAFSAELTHGPPKVGRLLALLGRRIV